MVVTTSLTGALFSMISTTAAMVSSRPSVICFTETVTSGRTWGICLTPSEFSYLAICAVVSLLTTLVLVLRPSGLLGERVADRA